MRISQVPRKPSFRTDTQLICIKEQFFNMPISFQTKDATLTIIFISYFFFFILILSGSPCNLRQLLNDFLSGQFGIDSQEGIFQSLNIIKLV